jgi:hypothetical protein
VQTDAPPLPLLVINQSEVQFAIAFDEFEFVICQQTLEAEALLGEEAVVGEEVAKFGLVHGPDGGQVSQFLDGVHPQYFNVQPHLLLVHFPILLMEGSASLRIFSPLRFILHNKIISHLPPISVSLRPHHSTEGPACLAGFYFLQGGQNWNSW